jgi:hypothetical protein
VRCEGNGSRNPEAGCRLDKFVRFELKSIFVTYIINFNQLKLNFLKRK